MSQESTDKQAITAVVQKYFLSTYHGDTSQLQQVFHAAVRITGILDGAAYDWSRQDFIARVTASPTAAEKNEPYNKEIVLMDISDAAAMVKARVVIGSILFTDYITLLKMNGQWIIRNKSFTGHSSIHL